VLLASSSVLARRHRHKRLVHLPRSTRLSTAAWRSSDNPISSPYDEDMRCCRWWFVELQSDASWSWSWSWPRGSSETTTPCASATWRLRRGAQARQLLPSLPHGVPGLRLGMAGLLHWAWPAQLLSDHDESVRQAF
jgi:hypothetical protein